MSQHIIDLTEENYTEEVLESPVPVLVDFYAEWCGPCKALGPVIEELAEKYQGRVKICKLDVDKGRKLAISNKVMGVPTLFFVKGGEVVERVSAALPQPAIEEKLEALL
ncbi:MAG: thioredoxin [Bacillota bacterium]|nr:thioredoxin [Bacillota bacterium]